LTSWLVGFATAEQVCIVSDCRKADNELSVLIEFIEINGIYKK